jgi:hypothetical protein
MNDPTPGLRPLRRYRNRSNGIAKLEIAVPAGEEIEVPEGSIANLDRQPLDDLTVDTGPASPPAPAEAPGEDLSALKKADLVTLATERGVDTSGTKAELVARLTDVDDD